METTTASVPENKSGRDRKAEITRDVIDALLGAVSHDDDGPDEYGIIGAVMARAGIAWRCISRECRCINHLNVEYCDNCNRRRPKVRDTPELEDMGRLSLEYRRVELKKLAAKAKEEKENV